MAERLSLTFTRAQSGRGKMRRKPDRPSSVEANVDAEWQETLRRVADNDPTLTEVK